MIVTVGMRRPPKISAFTASRPSNLLASAADHSRVRCEQPHAYQSISINLSLVFLCKQQVAAVSIKYARKRWYHRTILSLRESPRAFTYPGVHEVYLPSVLTENQLKIHYNNDDAIQKSSYATLKIQQSQLMLLYMILLRLHNNPATHHNPRQSKPANPQSHVKKGHLPRQIDARAKPSQSPHK